MGSKAALRHTGEDLQRPFEGVGAVAGQVTFIRPWKPSVPFVSFLHFV